MTDKVNAGDGCLQQTARIVTAYLAHNPVPGSDLPGFIAVVHGTLSSLGTAPAAPPAAKPVPAIAVRKSITPDFLVSLEDGRRYKSLKRHLAGRGLTPADYRIKWGLDFDYPMVAPNYAKRRSELAKAAGLGLRRPEPAKAVRRGRAKHG